MLSRKKLGVPLLSLLLSLGLIAAPAQAQTQSGTPVSTPEKQHVVSLGDLSRDAAGPGQIRQGNEAAVRELLRSEAGQKALKSVNIGYEKVDKAVGQLSDEDLARVADRSRQAENDFAAGGIGATLIVAIVLIVVLAVVLSAVFR
jgi:hypothetical protein